MELKDFIKILFEKPEEYKKLSSAIKQKHFFMVQRFASIAFPLQAQAFNHIKIEQSVVVDYWHENFIKLYTKVPGWIYTKTKKSTVKKKADMPSDEATRFYLEKMNMSKKELNESIKLFGDVVLEPIRKIEAIMAE